MSTLRPPALRGLGLIFALALAGACQSNQHPATGAAGASGTAGTTGASGTNGASGTGAAAGTTGSSGTTGGAGNGAAGTTGASGTNGAAGTGAAAGTTGSSGTTGAGGTTDGGATDASGNGAAGIYGGPPAFSTKPISVIAYSPYRDGQAPGGVQPTMAQVQQDLMMLKPLVDGIRVYGTDGAQGYIPALCDQLGIDLHIGAWIDGIASDVPNVQALIKIVNENHPSIKTAIVGNEVLARSAKNGVTEQRMIDLINMARAGITVKTVKIAEADTYPQWMMGRPNLAAAVDLIIWHTYAWWSGADISNAYALVNSRYNDMLTMYPGKPMVLGETGWPTQVDHMSPDGGVPVTTAVGNEANQAKYLTDALAGFRSRNLPMWIFDSIDEKWKATSGEGEVGAHWGIFTSARAPKQAATQLMMMIK
jgi:exo-beta-1,3-glucanase (GH17 family)